MENLHEEIEALYKNDMSIKEISYVLGTSIGSIKNVLVRYNVKIKPSTRPDDTRIVQYDKYFNPIKLFYSKVEIADWLINNTDYAYHQRTLYTAITNACNDGCVRYGHRWQRASDLTHGGKVFRTKFDKEEYLTGKEAYRPDGKPYYIVDGALSKVKTFSRTAKCADHRKTLIRKKSIRHKEHSKKSKNITKEPNMICKQCGRTVTWLSSSGTCMSCYNVSIKGKTPKPSKEELSKLLASGMKKSQIAAMYGRTASTIHYWIKSYEIGQN